MLDVLKLLTSDRMMIVRTLAGLELWLAVVVALSIGFLPAELMPNDQVRLVDVAKQIFTYSSIGFSACMGGITMLMRISDARFLEALEQARLEGGKKSKVNHLPMALFSITWTALWHWVSLVLCLVVIMLVEPTRPMLQVAGGGGRIIPAAVLFLFTYNVIQFLSTVGLIASMGLQFANYQRAKITQGRS